MNFASYPLSLKPLTGPLLLNVVWDLPLREELHLKSPQATTEVNVDKFDVPLFWSVLFLEFHPRVDRLEIFHMNRQQKFVRLPGSYEEAPTLACELFHLFMHDFFHTYVHTHITLFDTAGYCKIFATLQLMWICLNQI